MYPEIKVITEDLTTIANTNQSYNTFYAGYFERGPVNEITKISSVYDLKITFGKPTKDNYKEYFQIYNYFSYGNSCIYIVRTDSAVSQCAKSPDYDIQAKYPGDYGNNIVVKSDASRIEVYLNNSLVETLQYGDLSYYINYNLEPQEFETRLEGGLHGLPSSLDIQNAYELAEDENYDFDFILANPNYEYSAIRLSERKNAIAFTYSVNTNCICYYGVKSQRSIFDGKTYEIPILGDAVGMRSFLANTEGLGESHCKRGYVLNNIIKAKIPNLRELYDKKINSIGKSENGYYFNSEVMGNGQNLTTELILNRLKKESADLARYFVFELNDDFTRNDLTKKLQMLCESYKDNRYLTDYQIVCNENNQNINEPNSMYADVYVKIPGIIENVIIKLKAVIEI